MNDSVENFIYASFISVGYVLLKTRWWSFWNLFKVFILLIKINLASAKVRNWFWTIFKSKINVTNRLLLLFTSLTWGQQKSVYVKDSSCRSLCRYIWIVFLFFYRNISASFELLLWKYYVSSWKHIMKHLLSQHFAW